MLFLTAVSIGFCVAMMRSAFSLAFVAFLLFVTFALASVLSAGPVSYMNLLVAVLGYNFGILNFIAGLFALRSVRPA